MDREARMAIVHGVTKKSDMIEQLNTYFTCKSLWPALCKDHIFYSNWSILRMKGTTFIKHTGLTSINWDGFGRRGT